ncbi:MAG: hypothetical protein AAF417_23135 [Pseudomonadota bacterium]
MGDPTESNGIVRGEVIAVEGSSTWVLRVPTQVAVRYPVDEVLEPLTELRFGETFQFEVDEQYERGISVRGQLSGARVEISYRDLSAIAESRFGPHSFDLMFMKRTSVPTSSGRRMVRYALTLRDPQEGETPEPAFDELAEQFLRKVNTGGPPTAVVYYQKSRDVRTLRSAISGLPKSHFDAVIRKSTKAMHIDDQTNYIWCGEEVEIDRVRALALRVMQAGTELFGVSGFPKSSAAKKSKLINVGAVWPEPGEFVTAADLENIDCEPF